MAGAFSGLMDFMKGTVKNEPQLTFLKPNQGKTSSKENEALALAPAALPLEDQDTKPQASKQMDENMGLEDWEKQAYQKLQARKAGAMKRPAAAKSIGNKVAEAKPAPKKKASSVAETTGLKLGCLACRGCKNGCKQCRRANYSGQRFTRAEWVGHAKKHGLK